MDSTQSCETLGERIVQAARMAVAIHLQSVDSPEVQPKRMLRPWIEIGRAGPLMFSDSHRGGMVTDD
jgi:hypothetical protein